MNFGRKIPPRRKKVKSVYRIIFVVVWPNLAIFLNVGLHVYHNNDTCVSDPVTVKSRVTKDTASRICLEKMMSYRVTSHAKWCRISGP